MNLYPMYAEKTPDNSVFLGRYCKDLILFSLSNCLFLQRRRRALKVKLLLSQNLNNTTHEGTFMDHKLWSSYLKIK